MPVQTHFDFRHPTRIVHGPGSIACLADCFSPADKVLIVSDQVLGEIGTVEAVTAALGDIPHAVYLKDGSSEPTQESVEDGAQAYRQERCTAIIGLGGGSPMDVAKMIGVLASNDGRITEYLGSEKVATDLPYLVCVPTTYGTASEVTPFAVLDNPASGNKDPVISWKIAPQVGVLDPDLSVALPALVGAATGMDALTHALESYINLAATPLTEGIALHAIPPHRRQPAPSLRQRPRASRHRKHAHRQYAGPASPFRKRASARSTPCPIQRAPTTTYITGCSTPSCCPMSWSSIGSPVPANLPPSPRRSARTFPGLDQRQAAHAAIAAVRHINSDLGIPAKLGDVGVDTARIRTMAHTAMQSGNIAVNPRKTSQRDLEALFQQAI